MPQYKDKERNTYYFKCQYTNWQGEKKTKLQRGFKTKAEAKKAEIEFLTSMATNCTISFEALAQHFLDYKKNRVKPSTYLQYSVCINTILIPYFRNMPIDTITPLVIQKWQNSLQDEKNAVQYKDTSLRRINTALSIVFNYATRFFKLNENPVKKAGTIGSSKSHRMDYWTIDEFEQFINTLHSIELSGKFSLNIYTYEVTFKTLFYTGIRFGEFLALTIGDFNKEESTLTINKTLSYISSKEILIQSPKTTASIRTISIPSKLCKLLEEYISKLPSQDSSDALFPILTRHRVEHIQTLVSKKAGIKRIRIHDLRHSHASLLIRLGVSPLAISKRLGHENIETTLNIYSHLYPNTSTEIATQLDSYSI